MQAAAREALAADPDLRRQVGLAALGLRETTGAERAAWEVAAALAAAVARTGSPAAPHVAADGARP